MNPSKGASDDDPHAPYATAADLQRILELKRACTTPENRYDAPTLSELRALLLTGMHWLKERGATSIFLETEQAETPALRLFTSLGFQRVSTWRWMTKEIAPLT